MSNQNFNFTDEVPETNPVQNVQFYTGPVNTNKPIGPDETKVELSDLPSLGKPYPESTEIWIKQFTFNELESFNNSHSVVDMLRIATQGITIRSSQLTVFDLTAEDILYLSVLRNLAIDKNMEFSIELTCPICGQRETFKKKISDIAFDEIEAPKLPIKIKDGANEYRLTALTYRVYKAIHELAKQDSDIDNIASFYENLNNPALTDKQIQERFELNKKELGELKNKELISVLLKAKTMLEHGIADQIYECANQTKEQAGGNNAFRLNMFSFESYNSFQSDEQKEHNRIEIQFGD